MKQPDKCTICGHPVPATTTTASASDAMEVEGEKDKDKDQIKINEHQAGVEPVRARCIVIKPTLRSWKKYTPSCHLHCGLSDSKGEGLPDLD